MPTPTWLTTLVILAGVGQIVLIIGSLAIPHQLGWREKLRATTPRVLERSPIFAHLWVIGWLAVPAAILFHPPFLAGVLWPLVGISS